MYGTENSSKSVEFDGKVKKVNIIEENHLGKERWRYGGEIQRKHREIVERQDRQETKQSTSSG